MEVHNLQVDSSGLVIEPRLHDAVLVGIATGSDWVTLRLILDSGTMIELRLVEATYFCAGPVLQSYLTGRGAAGNIVFEAHLQALRGVDLASYLEGAVPTEDLQDLLVRQATERDLLLFDILPTYGCSAVGLCRDVGWTACPPEEQGHR